MQKHFIIKTVFSILAIVLIVVAGLSLHKLAAIEKDIVEQGEMIGYRLTIKLNGADSVEKKVISCIETSEGCLVTLPKATRKNGEIIGYNLHSDDKTAKYWEKETVKLDDDMTLYVISKKKNNVIIDDHMVDYVSPKILSCDVYNDAEKCKVHLPVFNKKGYENRGYSTSTSSLVGFVFPNEDYIISKDVTLYPVYGLLNHNQILDITNTILFNNSVVEIEKNCPLEVQNDYLNYLEEIKKYASYLLIGNKISFIGDELFDKIWGSGYVGMNYGPKNLRAVDIRCSNVLINDYYGTMVHEMSHSWDFYYATKIGKNITSESDIINLFNKYKAMDSRPFRNYSYSNIYEFLADMMKYYYFKYIVPKDGYQELNFPQDMKKTIEKYICIAKNDYDKTRCSEVK